MYCAMEIARYIIDKCTVDQQPVCNLQLQSLLFYIQTSFLQSGLVAFGNDFEAWQVGPVIPDVYYKYCGFGARRIRQRYSTNVDRDYRHIIDPVIEAKRLLKPWEIKEEILAPGGAWDVIYRNGIGNHCVIPKELL